MVQLLAHIQELILTHIAERVVLAVRKQGHHIAGRLHHLKMEQVLLRIVEQAVLAALLQAHRTVALLLHRKVVQLIQNLPDLIN
ncbi:hypothetical protein GCM10028805_38440 [Spirosoma harenae]